MIDFSEAPQVIRDYLSYMETIKGKSKNTTKEYFFDLRTFFRFMKIHKGYVDKDADFEKIPIDDINVELIKTITLSDLYEYMAYVNRKRGNNANSRARKVASIKSFFSYLNTKAKLIDINPAKELESPKIQKRMPRYLNLEESKQLLYAINGEYKERDYAILTLFLNCGLRLSELVSINLNKIKNDTLTVVGKGNKERTIYLNKACINAINNYLRVRPVNGVKDKNALFLSERKQRISNKTVQYIVKKYIKQAGLDPEKYSTHKLRHTAATLMYKHGGVDIRALQEILGHENLSTTEIYTHVDNEQLRNAVDQNPLANIIKEGE
ncbi:MAG: hypothetical protein PWR27_1383 [Petroclostridium sp.]|uniref:tyrosine recombinase XerC n=1 Tax=Petroclostridium xylanilyticum TaxID=1792311 RepID=UPI000B98AD56|nr:tyrosine recombinase XerC [Petroclostridium xylanilyticum]MBZ4646574.1 recombinase XerC [Clostridia bacterium]MDK2810674.1 hypothetical protein [Petroclostridium sp.]